MKKNMNKKISAVRLCSAAAVLIVLSGCSRKADAQSPAADSQPAETAGSGSVQETAPDAGSTFKLTKEQTVHAYGGIYSADYATDNDCVHIVRADGFDADYLGTLVSDWKLTVRYNENNTFTMSFTGWQGCSEEITVPADSVKKNSVIKFQPEDPDGGTYSVEITVPDELCLMNFTADIRTFKGNTVVLQGTMKKSGFIYPDGGDGKTFFGNLSGKDKEFSDYLINHSFFGEHGESLLFSDDGSFVCNDWSGNKAEGNYYINGSSVYLTYPRRQKGDDNSFTLPLLLVFDDTYEDLFYSKRLTGENNILTSSELSPAGKVYTYNGVKVLKYPPLALEQAPDRKYAVPAENLKMRDKPSMDGNLVTMGFGYTDNGKEKYIQRTVVFEGDVLPIIGISPAKDTIDGITAAWYLVDETDNMENPVEKYDSAYVWIFGGYLKEIGAEEYDAYEAAAEKNIAAVVNAYVNK